MSQRFYTSSDLHAGSVILQGPEAHHLAHVCRYQPGDQIILFNGNGCEYPAQVARIDRKSVELEVLAEQRPQRELPCPLEIAVALPKGERVDWMVEKLTELGVTAIIPLRTRRSVVTVSPAKTSRLRRIVIEASKQCGRNTLMEVRDLVTWSQFCSTVESSRQRWLAHPSGGFPSSQMRLVQPTIVAIGPEGGWATDEIELAKTYGWQCLGLGPRVLRIETAAIACAASLTVSVG